MLSSSSSKSYEYEEVVGAVYEYDKVVGAVYGAVEGSPDGGKGGG